MQFGNKLKRRVSLNWKDNPAFSNYPKSEQKLLEDRPNLTYYEKLEKMGNIDKRLYEKLNLRNILHKPLLRDELFDYTKHAQKTQIGYFTSRKKFKERAHGQMALSNLKIRDSMDKLKDFQVDE